MGPPPWCPPLGSSRSCHGLEALEMGPPPRTILVHMTRRLAEWHPFEGEGCACFVRIGRTSANIPSWDAEVAGQWWRWRATQFAPLPGSLHDALAATLLRRNAWWRKTCWGHAPQRHRLRPAAWPLAFREAVWGLVGPIRTHKFVAHVTRNNPDHVQPARRGRVARMTPCLRVLSFFADCEAHVCFARLLRMSTLRVRSRATGRQDKMTWDLDEAGGGVLGGGARTRGT